MQLWWMSEPSFAPIGDLIKPIELHGDAGSRSPMQATSTVANQDIGRPLTPASLQSSVSPPPVKRKVGQGGAVDGTTSASKRRKRTNLPKVKIGDKNLSNLDSLFTGDPVTERAQLSGNPTPSFKSTKRRADAMKDLRHTGANRAEVQLLDQACATFPGKVEFVSVDMEDPKGDKSRYKLKGLKTPLFAHQLIGAAKLRRRETGEDEVRGGLLADQMGLGKTIQMIANIVHGFRDSSESRTGRTLIVATANLLGQWEQEIHQHVENVPEVVGRVCQYSFSSVKRLWAIGDSTENAVEFLTPQNIVLASYNEVAKSYAHDKPPLTTGDFEQDLQTHHEYQQMLSKKQGALHSMKWHRVVLDEAQHIKNYRTKTAKACIALSAKHFWAMSGTPFSNSIEESFAYFRLLRMPHTNNIETFRKHYLKYNSQQLHKDLEKLMIRRSWMDKLFNQPIAYAPSTTSYDHLVKPKPVEWLISKAIWAKNAKKVQAVQRKDIPSARKRRIVMSLLQRIRQITVHWFLVLDIIGSRDRTDIIMLVEEFGTALSEETVARTCDYIIEIAEKAKRAKEDFKRDEGFIELKNHDKVQKYLDAGMPVPAKIAEPGPPKKDCFSIHHWTISGYPLLHSSKTEAVIDLISTRLVKTPLRKFIVFTQSRPIIQILSRLLTREKIRHLSFHGGMHRNDRSRAIDNFRKESDKSVLIMSLFAGGEGLNLACASCVINIDLWWNISKEEQAHMRIIRINQMQETEIIRIVLEDTFDQHIIQKQQKKQAKINPAMHAGSKRSKELSYEDMLQVLGECDVKSLDVSDSEGSRVDENDLESWMEIDEDELKRNHVDAYGEGEASRSIDDLMRQAADSTRSEARQGAESDSTTGLDDLLDRYSSI